MIEKIVLLIIKVNNINFWSIVGRTLLACTKNGWTRNLVRKYLTINLLFYCSIVVGGFLLWEKL